METFSLRPELRKKLERYAHEENTSPNELLNDLVAQYISDYEHYKLEMEIEAYRQVHSELKKKYLGEWVAFHDKQLIDHDSDKGALHRRVRQRFGRQPILIRQVEQEPERVLWWRTPIVERRFS